MAGIVADENLPLIAAPGDEAALSAALAIAASDPALRAMVGAANRARALAEYGEAAMVNAYRAVYGAALGRSAGAGGFPPKLTAI